MRRVTTISVACAVFAAAAGQSFGSTCTFTATVGDWNEPDNWLDCNNQKPGATDTVIIPTGKHCKVENAFQAAGSITVNTGGLLGVIAPQVLALHGDSTVNGTLYLKGTPIATPGLRIAADLTLGGSGELSGRRSDGYGHGAVVKTINETLTIANGFTVAGTLHLSCGTFVNNGTCVVDDSLDVMTVVSSTGGLSGSGSFEVSDGLIKAGWVNAGPAPHPTWKVSQSGWLWKTDANCIVCTDFPGSFEVSGGTLDVDVDLCTEGKLTFSGGTIEVASGKSAAFSSTCK